MMCCARIRLRRHPRNVDFFMIKQRPQRHFDWKIQHKTASLAKTWRFRPRVSRESRGRLCVLETQNGQNRPRETRETIFQYKLYSRNRVPESRGAPSQRKCWKNKHFYNPRAGDSASFSVAAALRCGARNGDFF